MLWDEKMSDTLIINLQLLRNCTRNSLFTIDKCKMIRHVIKRLHNFVIHQEER
jgi:hypothetical protein